MSFISLEFVLLFLLCFTSYHFVSDKRRKFVLLAASGVFIGYFNPAFLVTALVVSLFTYGAAILIEQAREKGRGSRLIYWGGIFCLVLCWMGFRYANRLTGNSGFIFPLGMSFYTFQAIGYLTEVYWEEEKAERRPIDFLLYMLLFMKFLSGPIERSADLLPQVRKLSPVSYSMMTYGLKLIVVGLVKKLVLADHIAPYIDGVFSSMHTASGVQLLMACLLYPIELYADFSGYTDMAIGGAMMFGYRLSPNFNRPFAAKTITDFWRRWHMSLSFWVRDYLYQPIAASKRYWGQWGIVYALVVTFVLLGVWHGAGWNYVIYGLIQGLIISYEMVTVAYRNKVETSVGKHVFGAYSILRTYLLFAFSLLFFRLPSLSDAGYMISHLSFNLHTSIKELRLGMTDQECIVTGVAVVLLFLYEYFMSKQDLLQALNQRHRIIRWGVYYLIVLLMFLFGQFGSEDFIYLQF